MNFYIFFIDQLFKFSHRIKLSAIKVSGLIEVIQVTRWNRCDKFHDYLFEVQPEICEMHSRNAGRWILCF